MSSILLDTSIPATVAPWTARCRLTRQAGRLRSSGLRSSAREATRGTQPHEGVVVPPEPSRD